MRASSSPAATAWVPKRTSGWCTNWPTFWEAKWAPAAAVDAGFTEHARQVGQTGVTVRPKLYIACGISGQIQHTAGMDQSSMVISINSDPEAPINKIADYAITGDVNEIIPKMIKYYKQNSK